MTVSACSTTQSVELMEVPKIEIQELKSPPPADVMTGCDDLIPYSTKDERDMVRVTIQNHNIYYDCASKLRSAIIYIDST